MKHIWIIRAALFVGVAITFTISVQCANLDGLRLPNVDVIGKQVTAKLELFGPETGKVLEPKNITLDVENGVIIGALIVYPKKITFEQCVTSINRVHKQHLRNGYLEHGMGIWRIEERRCTIQLTTTDDEIKVIILGFQPTDRVIGNIGGALEKKGK